MPKSVEEEGCVSSDTEVEDLDAFYPESEVPRIFKTYDYMQ